VFTRETPNVKREIERKFCPDQNWANFGGFGVLRVRGFNKLQFLPQKAHVFVNPRRLSHFRQNRSRGVTSSSVGEKNKESHRGSHRKDMSPLTQGLNYRSACDRPTANLGFKMSAAKQYQCCQCLRCIETVVTLMHFSKLLQINGEGDQCTNIAVSDQTYPTTLATFHFYIRLSA